MCVNYKAPPKPETYREDFDVEPPAQLGKIDVWPGYPAGFIRRHVNADVGDDAVPPKEALTGLFGMVPRWAKEPKSKYPTYNARSETVAEKATFRDSWRQGRHCIIPAEYFVEPDWRSGKSIPAKIQRADGKPMGIAGLWEDWRSPNGELIYSFTMLTINAADHAVMRNFHKPEDEKRMVVILPESRYQDWLGADARHSQDFLLPYPAENLTYEHAPKA